MALKSMATNLLKDSIYTLRALRAQLECGRKPQMSAEEEKQLPNNLSCSKKEQTASEDSESSIILNPRKQGGVGSHLKTFQGSRSTKILCFGDPMNLLRFNGSYRRAKCLRMHYSFIFSFI